MKAFFESMVEAYVTRVECGLFLHGWWAERNVKANYLVVPYVNETMLDSLHKSVQRFATRWMIDSSKQCYININDMIYSAEMYDRFGLASPSLTSEAVAFYEDNELWSLPLIRLGNK